jgi:hypothetical protein
MIEKRLRYMFIFGTLFFLGVLIALGVDTLAQVKSARTPALSESVIAGKQHWQQQNCNDCHTIKHKHLFGTRQRVGTLNPCATDFGCTDGSCKNILSLLILPLTHKSSYEEYVLKKMQRANHRCIFFM